MSHSDRRQGRHTDGCDQRRQSGGGAGAGAAASFAHLRGSAAAGLGCFLSCGSGSWTAGQASGCAQKRGMRRAKERGQLGELAALQAMPNWVVDACASRGSGVERAPSAH